MNPRIEQLERFRISRPDDPFVVYALAIEYRNGGDTARAELNFREVYARFPEYIPTYLHFGGLLHELGNREEARKVYGEGIEKARQAGENHALSELGEALTLLMEDE